MSGQLYYVAEEKEDQLTPPSRNIEGPVKTQPAFVSVQLLATSGGGVGATQLFAFGGGTHPFGHHGLDSFAP